MADSVQDVHVDPHTRTRSALQGDEGGGGPASPVMTSFRDVLHKYLDRVIHLHNWTIHHVFADNDFCAEPNGCRIFQCIPEK